MQTATSPSRSLRPRDAAEFLGIGLSTLWRWAKERHDFPKPARLSRNVSLFNEAELAKYRDARKVDA